MPAQTGDAVVESSPGEVRVALLEDESLAELLVFRRTDPPRLGEIFEGRVTRVERGYDAAFVEIGAGPPGFLALKGARGLREGERLVVAVAGEAAPGKGPRLARAPARAEPFRDTDLTAAALRAIAARDPGQILADGAACLARVRAAARAFPALANRISPHNGAAPAFEALGIEEEIDRALVGEVALASGLRLHFAETPALVAVDVDAASFAPRKGGRATALAANLAAVPALARGIRLRNLSGLVLIDFLRMKDAAERRRLVESFAGAASADPVPLHVHGFTRSGLLELTRERRLRPLSQVLMQPRPGPRKSVETVAHDALREAIRSQARGGALRLVAAPEVVAWLEGEGREDLGAAESLLHVKLIPQASPEMPPERFQVLDAAR